MFVISLRGYAQNISLDQFKNWKPRCIGPAGMSGRIVAIDAVINNPNIIYAGAASGGIWKTENSGHSWKPVFDDQPLQNIGSIAVQQSNPSVVWAGTGEGNPRNSLNIGEGIFKSLDAGKTWKRMGLEKTRNIHRIIIDPVNDNIVFAAAIGNPYAEHAERGVFKTTDGGETWSRVLYTNDSSGCAELVMDPANPNKLLAAMWQHRRTPWNMKSGGPGSGLYMTTDGGKRWKKLSKEDGLPGGQLGRIGIAIARNMPDRIYAKIEAAKNGLYRSDDGGIKWQLVNSNPADVTDRPFYYQEIYVDPANENRIYDIHSTVTFSEDGGKTFNTLLPYSGIHPDHHAWWVNPKDPNLIIEGNDGGIGISRDRGKTWVFDEKLPVGQFYHINVDNEIPYHVMGGMQDNGSWHGPAYTWTNSGLRNYFWNNIGGGDGFDVMPDADDANWVYSMSQGGFLGRRNINTGESWFVKPPSLDTTQFRFNWNTGIAQDPFDNSTVYFGSQFLHKSTDKGASWETISPDLTTNNARLQELSRETGGLTLDITGAETYNTIITVAPSYKEKGVIWVGTDDGNVQLTRDGGKSWTSFRGKIGGLPAGAWIPQIKTSKHQAGEAFVVANDYRRGDSRPYIFRTRDYGKTWTRLVDESKVKGYALCVLQDPEEEALIFAGTEHGLWISVDNGASFQQWKNGYPSVSTYDLALQEREADLVIATFGRAIWILDDIRPLRKITANSGRKFTSRITAFPSPVSYQSQYKPATGYDWSTYGLWDAENKKRGVPVSFFINTVQDVVKKEISTAKRLSTKKDTVGKKFLPVMDSLQKPSLEIPAQTVTLPRDEATGLSRRPSDQDSLKKVTDSVMVQVYTDKNELIRTLRWGADSGFNRLYWGMEEKGFREPGSPRPDAGTAEPAGLQVLPGTYKIVIRLAKNTDSTVVTVKDDPRIANRNEVKMAQRKLYNRLQTNTGKLTEAMDRLTEIEDVAAKMQSQLKGLEGKESDSLRKITLAMLDSVKSIREFIRGKQSDKQGISRPPQQTLMTKIQQARTYITAKPLAPGEQEEKLVNMAETAIKEGLSKINGFVDGRWKDYRRQAEGTKISLFKEYKAIE
ncbi:MAG: hypothetical protein WKF97_13750 [Chitinophagaceae bacterium]